jgi:hypothetical protein
MVNGAKVRPRATPLEDQVLATEGLGRLTRVLVRGGGHDLFEAHAAVPGMLPTSSPARPCRQWA